MAVPRVAGPLLKAIAASTAWLEQAGIPAAVIGGVAASLLGRPRVTKDVDLIALAEDSDVARLLLTGREHGFEPRVADALAFAKVSRVLLLKHEPSNIEIDLALAGLAFEREVIARAVERSVRGVSFRVATAEDIVVMKAIAMRPRDLADIEAILDAGQPLDLERIRGLLKSFTEALETDDFSAEFERLLARHRGAR
jgi:predicted nucleotidyltransferase